MTTLRLMKAIGRSPSRLALFLTPLVFACFALASVVQAAAPLKPEDRGNGNSAAANVSALNPATSGADNTANGWFSLFSNTTGKENTANGYQALYSNTTGFDNTANGLDALFSNTTGSNNTANGDFALTSNTTGFANTANGDSALFSNTTGAANTANGLDALFSNTTGGDNTANGYQALLSNTTGKGNTANGDSALFSNTTGNGNTGNGFEALYSNTTGNDNTANGLFALFNTTGNLNTANGPFALYFNTTGNDNTANGYQALYFNTNGNNNVGLGYDAGLNIITASNVTCIGAGVGGADVSNTTWIANVYGTAPQNATTEPVVVSADGQLGIAVSSERFKKDISTMETASEVILSLRPVTFHYKTDTKSIPQFGLIAEEVAKVNPALVVPDKEGKPYTVRYDAVNAMLLNEFLKEHRKVQEQEVTVQEQEVTIAQLKSTVAQQQKDFQALTARLDEQASQIQKVSAQVEMSRPAPQMVLSNP